MLRLSLLLTVGVLALVGCSGDDDESTTKPGIVVGTIEGGTTSLPTTTRPPVKTKPSKPKPSAPEPKPTPPPSSSAPTSAAYNESRDLCSIFGPAQVAKEYGGGSNPVEVAHAYAEASYQPQFQQDAFEGCLAGFK